MHMCVHAKWRWHRSAVTVTATATIGRTAKGANWLPPHVPGVTARVRARKCEAAQRTSLRNSKPDMRTCYYSHQLRYGTLISPRTPATNILINEFYYSLTQS